MGILSTRNAVASLFLSVDTPFHIDTVRHIQDSLNPGPIRWQRPAEVDSILQQPETSTDQPKRDGHH